MGVPVFLPQGPYGAPMISRHGAKDACRGFVPGAVTGHACYRKTKAALEGRQVCALGMPGPCEHGCA